MSIELNTKRIALTFDVEEWYHIMYHTSNGNLKITQIVKHNIEIVLELLESVQAHATFFILGSVAEQNKDLVKLISKSGHEIGSHTHSHQLIYSQSLSAFREDIHRAKAILEGITGKAVDSFRAPGFSVNYENFQPIMDILAENGVIRDSSIFPMTHRHGGMPGYGNQPREISCPAGNIMEYPITIDDFKGFKYYALGGGYFRLFPLSLIRRNIFSIHNEGLTPILYLHPRDIDNLAPRVKASLKNKFMYYVNTRSSYSKLKYLIRNYTAVSLRELHQGGANVIFLRIVFWLLLSYISIDASDLVIDRIRIGETPLPHFVNVQFLTTPNTRYIKGDFALQLSNQITYDGSAIFTNDKKHVINASYERNDYKLFSTGKIYTSYIRIPLSILELTVGRLQVTPSELTLGTIELSSGYLSSDGYSVAVDQDHFSLKFSAGMFQADSIGSYDNKYLFQHSLTLHLRNWHVTLGEVMMSSDIENSLNLTRFNPFIPYTFYAYEQYESPRSNSEGDYDNLAIMLNLYWDRFPELMATLLIDEYHIDEVDRQKFYDQYLFALGYLYERGSFQDSHYLKFFAKVLIQSPAFGMHPGQTTSYYVRENPIFDSQAGRTFLLTFLIEKNIQSYFVVSFDASIEKYIEGYDLVDKARVQHKAEFNHLKYFWRGSGMLSGQYRLKSCGYLNIALIYSHEAFTPSVQAGYYF